MFLLWMLACADDLVQIAGVGAVYSTRCAAQMEAKGSEWFARCTPPACEEHFRSVALGNVVVSVDPAGGVAGYAERTCLQDLSTASALFQPVLEPEPSPVEAPAATVQPPAVPPVAPAPP